ncbi:MAG: hypothetical protein KF718_16845 [Polyangiaceae bacterium]|nr:hypothetical protein [Polyangiaceae bacterium]
MITIPFRLVQITQGAVDGPIMLRLVADDGNALSFTLDDAQQLKSLQVGQTIRVQLELPP